MKLLGFIFLELLLPFTISGLFFNVDWPWYRNSGTGGSYDHDENSCPPLKHGNGNIKYFKRVISYGMVQPDNYIQRGILTNGVFPAEPIVVNQWDTVVIECVNYLDHDFTLHFHGLLQKGTVRSDGVPSITQKPIASNGTYYYIINIREQLGTFIYHAHKELDIVWVFAPFIILERETYYGEKQPLKNYKGYHYDEERTLTVTQLWHQSTSSMFQGLIGAPFQDIPDTASILINGKGYGIWSQNSGTSSGLHVVNVERGKCYRFRFISVASDSAIQISIKNHICKIIEADGITTNTILTDHLNINSAQRYSCIICMDQPVDNYWIRAKMIPGPGPKGFAILHYAGAPNPEPLRKHIAKIDETTIDETKIDETKVVYDDPFWLKGQIIPSSTYPQGDLVYPVPKHVDKEIVIHSFQRTLPDGSKRFEINKVFNAIPDKPLIDVIQKDKTHLKSAGTYEILVGDSIQIVFINIVGNDGICEQHPWHLHGHTFYIVGDGADYYRPEIEGDAIQNKIEYLHKSKRPTNLPFRDVLTLFPNQTTTTTTQGTPCGWVAVRFVADNPGIWLVHCHLTAHLIMGKRFALYEHTKADPFLQDQCYYNGHYQKPY